MYAFDPLTLLQYNCHRNRPTHTWKHTQTDRGKYTRMHWHTQT